MTEFHNKCYLARVTSSAENDDIKGGPGKYIYKHMQINVFELVRLQKSVLYIHMYIYIYITNLT